MWLGINQDSELIDTQQFARLGVFVCFEIPAQDANAATPVISANGARRMFNRPTQLTVPLTCSPATAREPSFDELRLMVRKGFERDLPDTWHVDHYELAYAISMSLTGRNYELWLSLVDREWHSIYRTPTAQMAWYIRRYIAAQRSPCDSIDNLAAMYLADMYDPSQQPHLVPPICGHLLAKLQAQLPDRQFIIGDQEAGSRQSPPTPERRIVLDSATPEIDDSDVPITQTERLIQTVGLIRQLVVVSHCPAGHGAAYRNNAALFADLLRSRRIYRDLIENNLFTIIEQMSRPDDRTTLDELVIFLQHNNTWSQ